MDFPFLKKERKLPEKIFEAESLNVRDFIAPSSIEIQQGSLKVGEKLAKSFFVFSYPRYLSTGWFSPIINLDTPMDIAFFIHPVDTGLVLKQLRKKVTEVQAELIERQEKGLIRDPVLETAFQDMEALRDGLQTAQEKIFGFGLYITVYADTDKQLRDIELTLRSLLEGRLIFVKPALFQQKEGFISSSPYGMDLLQVHTPMNTSPLSSSFPFVSFDLSSNEGILYGVNRHNNSLILFDRFSLENANLLVFAKSGAGKSIIGDSPVLVKRGSEVRLEKIGQLVEKIIGKNGATQIEEDIEGVLDPDIEVYSFDKNLKGAWSKVTVAARKKAPNIFYKFTTRSGREITTTKDHNLVILKNNLLEVVKGSEAKIGQCVPLAREIQMTTSPTLNFNLLELLKDSKKIYVRGASEIISANYQFLKKATDDKLKLYLYKYQNGRLLPIKHFVKILELLKTSLSEANINKLKITSKRGKSSLPAVFPIAPAFARIIGYIVAEGCFTKDSVIITNLDKEFLTDLDQCLKEIGVLRFFANRGIIIAEKPFTELLKRIGISDKSGEKTVPSFLFNAKKEIVANFLKAYFEGDGGIEKNTFITATSKSKQLISEITYLLSFFGIIARISKTRKIATNSNWQEKKDYYKLSVSGQNNLRKFAENIGFVSSRKKESLAKTIGKNGNTNVDLIPTAGAIFKEIYDLFGYQLHNIQDISNIKREHYDPSPGKINELVAIIENRIERFKNLAATYKTLSELPSLATIIDIGKNDKELNRALWRTLGQSWRTVKNKGVKPGKELVHSGFSEMDLPIKSFGRALQPAIATCIRQNTSYELIQTAAQNIWENCQKILQEKIPSVEEKLLQLKLLANSDLFWDPIAKIENLQNKSDKYVYDLMVDNGVFVAGNGGMFVHNSYFCKIEILRSLMTGVDTIVIDPENEYKFLADSVGGSFFNISLSSDNHINPFDLPTPREDEDPEDVLRSNVINLVGLLRIMFGGLTPEEDAIIDRALTETYASKDITPQSDPGKWQDNMPIMSDFESILETMEGADSLVIRLRKFTQGTFSNFFNQPSNLSLDKNLIVFGIRDMEDELRPMAMFVVMRYIWNKIRSQMKKRMLLIDEAWWLMQSADGASFLFGMAKRARKYWLGVTTITQDVGDFLQSDYGLAIVANSSLQLLLKQSPAVVNQVQKTFNLTEQEKGLLLESGIGEGVFIAGQKHVAIRIVASYAEDQIITTSPEEILKIRKAKLEEE